MLAGEMGSDVREVADAVEQEERAGHMRRNAGGEIVYSAGLSVEPTRHEISFDGATRWTACAYDALGILGALGRDGRIRSRDPVNDEEIQIQVDSGRPVGSDAVLLYADGEDDCASVVDEWCPLVNLFQSAEAASAWAESTGVTGRILILDEAAVAGAAEWRPLLAGR